jgi:hypothetical protein
MPNPRTIKLHQLLIILLRRLAPLLIVHIRIGLPAGLCLLIFRLFRLANIIAKPE